MVNNTDNQEAPAESTAFTTQELEEALANYDKERQRVTVAPTTTQLLGAFDIICLVLNRSIGSGVFTIPPKLLAGTGSIGASLLLWLLAGFITLCALLCWLELGLTIPMYRIQQRSADEAVRVSAPRSGGEKNYLEYIFKHPPFLISCIFGIVFICLGNTAGNAIALGTNIMIAANYDPITGSTSNYHKGSVIGVAIASVTLACLFHAFSRRGGLLVNNLFAVIKVVILLIIITLGLVHAGGKYLRSYGINEMPPVEHGHSLATANITSAMINNATKSNFDNTTLFNGRHDFSSFVESLLFAVYAFAGFEQPFYVLSEVASPKKVLPRAIIAAMLITITLSTLVNVSYFCVVPKETYTDATGNVMDIASIFFHNIFESTLGSRGAKRSIAALVAFSIFGNILVFTFTAARVKQEIAKMGIIPKSLFFAEGYVTPWERFRNQNRRPQGPDEHFDLPETTPMAALGLHWFSTVFLILITAMLKPAAAYTLLIRLYAYVNIIVIGALIGGGLFYLKIDSWVRGKNGRNWASKTQWVPWLDPLPVIVYFVSMTFIAFASFARPAADSPFSSASIGYPWILVPALGLLSVLWGVIWWFRLEFTQWRERFRIAVTHTPFLVDDGHGNYIQKVELVEHERSYGR